MAGSTRRPDPGDRRARRLVLTEKARPILARILDLSSGVRARGFRQSVGGRRAAPGRPAAPGPRQSCRSRPAAGGAAAAARSTRREIGPLDAGCGSRLAWRRSGATSDDLGRRRGGAGPRRPARRRRGAAGDRPKAALVAPAAAAAADAARADRRAARRRLVVSDDGALHLDRRRLCRRGEGVDQQRGVRPRRRNRRPRQRAGEGRPGAVYPRSAAVPHRRRGGQGAARHGALPDRGIEGDLSAEKGRRRRHRGHPRLPAARVGAAAQSAGVGHRLAGAIRPDEPRLQDRPRSSSPRRSRTSPAPSPASAAIPTSRSPSIRWCSMPRRRWIAPS